MLRFAIDAGVIGRMPKVPFNRVTDNRLRILTKDEAKLLLKVWKDWDQIELWCFTVFALHTGSRLNAMLTIKWRDFGPDYKTVYFAGGDKKSNPRTLPMSDVAIKAMRIMKERHPNQLGPFMHMKKDGTLRTMWDRMQDYLKWDDVVIHTLRHTCATWMLEATGNLKKVQTWLGHKHIATTLIYAHLVPGALDGMASVMDTAIGE